MKMRKTRKDYPTPVKNKILAYLKLKKDNRATITDIVNDLGFKRHNTWIAIDNMRSRGMVTTEKSRTTPPQITVVLNT